MYIPEHMYAVTIVLAGANLKLSLLERGPYEWVDNVVLALGTFITYVLSVLVHWCRSIVSALCVFFNDPSMSIVNSLILCYKTLHNHPHIVYLTALSLFFGPIILLLPFLLIHEIAILLLFNLSFATHGLIPGRVEDQYDALKEHFMESREQVFASVDAATAIFNKWTTDYFALMLARILAGIVGLYTLYGLWGGWSSV